MVFGFAAWAISLLVLSVITLRLGGGETAPGSTYLQAAALICAGLGACLLACFPTDRGAEVPGVVTHATAAGRVHDLASALVTAGVLVAALVGAARSRNSFRAFTLALLAISISSTVVLLAIGDPLPGIRQRILLGAGCLWQVALLWVSYRGLASTSPRSIPGSRCSTS